MSVNTAREEVTIEINGTDYPIRMGLNALGLITSEFNISLEGVPGLLRELSPDSMKFIVSACLVGVDMTPDEVGDAEVPLFGAMNALSEACILAMWGAKGPPSDPTTATTQEETTN